MWNIHRKISASLSPDKKFIASLKNLLGFYPDNLSLYKLAFMRRTNASKAKPIAMASNERLEYLGDAILGAVIAHCLFKKFPFRDEGFLTEMRSKIVNRAYLNQLATKIGIPDFLEHNATSTKFKSINGDALEALIGAIYLDQGYKITQNFIIKRLIKNHIDIDSLLNQESNFKSKLIEWVQKEKKTIKFEVAEEACAENNYLYSINVLIDDEVSGNGKDFSKKKAEQMAAEMACLEIFKD